MQVTLATLCKISIFAGIILYCVFVLWLYGLRFNSTASMPKGIYHIASETITRGDNVSFCLEGEFAETALQRGYLQKGLCSSGSQPLVKLVAALPYDKLITDEQGISINGALWPNSLALPTDSNGRPLSAASLPEEIPHGYVLLLSENHKGGFDGRYFGLVPLSKIRRVIALITF